MARLPGNSLFPWSRWVHRRLLSPKRRQILGGQSSYPWKCVKDYLQKNSFYEARATLFSCVRHVRKVGKCNERWPLLLLENMKVQQAKLMLPGYIAVNDVKYWPGGFQNATNSATIVCPTLGTSCKLCKLECRSCLIKGMCLLCIKYACRYSSKK